MGQSGLCDRTEARRVAVSNSLSTKDRTTWGQFFTPLSVSRFLASLIEVPSGGAFSVLDPGAGVGSLSAAMVERAIAMGRSETVHLVAVEADPVLLPFLEETLNDCRSTARQAGLDLTTEIVQSDFLLWCSSQTEGTDRRPFNACIMNPPYRKIGAGSAERKTMDALGVRVTNLYTAFFAAGLLLLGEGGQISAITPRSFANGPYFLPFREFILDRISLKRIHVYESRGDVFADTDVLQENVVIGAVRNTDGGEITLSSSLNSTDEPSARAVALAQVIHPGDHQRFIRIPLDDEATADAGWVCSLPSSLDDLGLTVSTGRVVDFRCRDLLVQDPREGDAPLLYPAHLSSGVVLWPLSEGRKPNAIEISDGTEALLSPAGTYVVVKRFTAKEEERRVVASVVQDADARNGFFAFENHLNVFHSRGAGFDADVAWGLSLFLNSSVVDRYVRQFSGHTQINATDLRELRYPSVDVLRLLGEKVTSSGWPQSQCEKDDLLRLAVPEPVPKPPLLEHV